MRVRLLRSAAADLRRIVDYIAPQDRGAAERLVRRIDAHLALVAGTRFVEMDRAGPRPGTREFVEGKYVVTYRYVDPADELVVISIVHGARRR